MSINGHSREYTWQDILCLVLKDMGLDPNDRTHHDMWYLDGTPPNQDKVPFLRIVKYDMDYRARLEEQAKDKL